RPADDGPVCLGFAFGAWTPKLDWHAAGHTVDPSSVHMDRAEGGRDWAAPPSGIAGDTALLLFPHWWPAGVAVALPTRAPAVGDPHAALGIGIGSVAALSLFKRVRPS